VPCTHRVKPILISLEHKISVNQLARGSTIFVVSHAREGSTFGIDARVPGLARSKGRRPSAKRGRSRGVTPDMQPVLGETPIEKLYVALSSYRGFMTSPAVGRMMADLVVKASMAILFSTNFRPAGSRRATRSSNRC
jgi:sarcosine oxidase subunit beta